MKNRRKTPTASAPLPINNDDGGIEGKDLTPESDIDKSKIFGTLSIEKLNYEKSDFTGLSICEIENIEKKVDMILKLCSDEDTNKIKGAVDAFVNGSEEEAKECAIIGYVIGDKGAYRDLYFQCLYVAMKKLKDSDSLNIVYRNLDNEQMPDIEKNIKTIIFVDRVISTKWPLYKEFISRITKGNNAQIRIIVGIDTMDVLKNKQSSQGNGLCCTVEVSKKDNIEEALEVIYAINDRNLDSSNINDYSNRIKSYIIRYKSTLNMSLIFDLAKYKEENDLFNSWNIVDNDTNDIKVGEIERLVKQLNKNDDVNARDSEKKLREKLKHFLHDSQYNYLLAQEYVNQLTGLNEAELYAYLLLKKFNDDMREQLQNNDIKYSIEECLLAVATNEDGRIANIESFIQRVFPHEVDCYIKDIIGKDQSTKDQSTKDQSTKDQSTRDSIIDKVIKIIKNEQFIDVIDPKWQSHLLYLLGRIGAQSASKQSDINGALEKAYKKCEKAYDYCDPESAAKKRYGFTLRTIALAYMCLDDYAKSKEFFKKILKDPTLRHINNSFPQWYYNHKSLQYDKTDSESEKNPVWDIPVEDNIEHLPETLKGLLDTVARKENDDKSISEGLVLLQLFTCCTLWQAYYGLQESEKSKIVNKMEEIKKTLMNYLNKYYKVCDKENECKDKSQVDLSQNNGSVSNDGAQKEKDSKTNQPYYDRELFNYFSRMYSLLGGKSEDGGSESKNGGSGGGYKPKEKRDLYDQFTKCNEVLRRNWLIRGVDSSECESIAEHVYDTWLLAFLFLPETLKDVVIEEDKNIDIENYNKHDIETMILLHDLPKSTTGDLLAYDDASKRGEFIRDELDGEMQEIVFQASFPSAGTNLRECMLWNEWKENESYNSLVAHDINQIQAVARWMYYHKKYKKQNKELHESKYSFFSTWYRTYIEDRSANQSWYERYDITDEKNVGAKLANGGLKTALGKRIALELFGPTSQTSDQS